MYDITQILEVKISLYFSAFDDLNCKFLTITLGKQSNPWFELLVIACNCRKKFFFMIKQKVCFYRRLQYN